MEFKNKKVNLFGTTYSIKFVNEIILDEDSPEKLYGITDTINKEIKIARTINKQKVSDNEIQLTLLHELTHAILFTGQYNKEGDDEHLVEWIARCLNECLNHKII